MLLHNSGNTIDCINATVTLYSIDITTVLAWVVGYGKAMLTQPRANWYEALL